MSNYPAQIDNSLSLPAAVNNATTVSASVANKLREAILATQTELGVKPSGTESTVRYRLDLMSDSIASLLANSISLGTQDLGGTPLLPKVVGLQGRPLSSTAPIVGQVIGWSGIAWIPTTVSGGGGGDTLPVATVANSVLQRSYPPGTDLSFFAPLTLDQILAAYSCSLFYAGATIVETSAMVATPAFTASYLRTAAAAVLTDTIPTTPQDVIGTPTTFSSTGTFQKTTPNQFVTFTLTANETGGPSKTSTITIYWGQKNYYGNAVPGTLNEAFIEALSTGTLAIAASGGFTATAGATERLYYAAPTRYGTPIFTVGGFVGGFHSGGVVSVTNAQSYAENYEIWESDNVNLGLTTVVIT